MGVVVRLEYSHVGRIAAALMPAVTKVLDETAIAIVAEATINTVRIDTGLMHNGWRFTADTPLSREITNTQEYWVFNEYGTSRMAASPMITPAVEHNRLPFTDALKKVFDGK